MSMTTNIRNIDYTPESLVERPNAELLLLKARLTWEVGGIEAQLLERTDDPDEAWRRAAKTAAHHRRRELASVNNALAIVGARFRSMWSEDDHGQSVLICIQKLIKVWEVAASVIEAIDHDVDDPAVDELLDDLSTAVEFAREHYFAVRLD